MFKLDYGICIYFLFFYSFNVRFCLKADGKGALPTKLGKCSMEKLHQVARMGPLQSRALLLIKKKCFSEVTGKF